jgi:hypothetical protein
MTWNGLHAGRMVWVENDWMTPQSWPTQPTQSEDWDGTSDGACEMATTVEEYPCAFSRDPLAELY